MIVNREVTASLVFSVNAVPVVPIVVLPIPSVWTKTVPLAMQQRNVQEAPVERSVMIPALPMPTVPDNLVVDAIIASSENVVPPVGISVKKIPTASRRVAQSVLEASATTIKDRLSSISLYLYA